MKQRQTWRLAWLRIRSLSCRLSLWQPQSAVFLIVNLVWCLRPRTLSKSERKVALTIRHKTRLQKKKVKPLCILKAIMIPQGLICPTASQLPLKTLFIRLVTSYLRQKRSSSYKRSQDLTHRALQRPIGATLSCKLTQALKWRVAQIMDQVKLMYKSWTKKELNRKCQLFPKSLLNTYPVHQRRTLALPSSSHRIKERTTVLQLRKTQASQSTTKHE